MFRTVSLQARWYYWNRSARDVAMRVCVTIWTQVCTDSRTTVTESSVLVSWSCFVFCDSTAMTDGIMHLYGSLQARTAIVLLLVPWRASFLPAASLQLTQRELHDSVSHSSPESPDKHRWFRGHYSRASFFPCRDSILSRNHTCHCIYWSQT